MLEEQEVKQRKKRAKPLSEEVISKVKAMKSLDEKAMILAKQFEGRMTAFDMTVAIEKLEDDPENPYILRAYVVSEMTRFKLFEWIEKGDVKTVKKALEFIEAAELDEPIEYGCLPEYFNKANGNQKIIKLLWDFGEQHGHFDNGDLPSQEVGNDATCKILEKLEKEAGME